MEEATKQAEAPHTEEKDLEPTVQTNSSDNVTSTIPMETNEQEGSETLNGSSDIEPNSANHTPNKILRGKRKFPRSQNRLNDSDSELKELKSQGMTEDDKKMLEFYHKRLTTLKRDNELLHRRLLFFVKENMRLLKV